MTMISNLQYLLLLSIFTLILTQIGANNAGDGSDEPESFQIESDKLSLKIQSLESLVDKKSEELRTQDEIIAEKDMAISEKERTIKEKLESLDLLRNEVASLKVKGSTDASEEVPKAHTRSQELGKLVERLQLELELKVSLQEALETRAIELEKNMLETNPKIQELEQTIEEQKTKIQKTERALKSAEEELMKTKNEATRRVSELMEVIM
ncbi:uncharacterized protein LOC143597674 [Bidens hawaiensis]|uniref:uncharacterized protein LOC143597674 n=1 Tax=Bidens hawaiensis TaxID=980011 RepID=UPI00404AEED2